MHLSGSTRRADALAGHARVPLTHKAFEILLSVLVDRAGHVVGRDTLLGAVWPDTNVHPDNVKVLIGEIRRALGDDPARPHFIRSIVKRGYVFIAPVVEAPRDLSPPTARAADLRRPGIADAAALGAFDAAVRASARSSSSPARAGVGKTSLCEAFLRVAARRHAMRATWTRCVKLDRPLGTVPVRSATS